MLGLSRSDSFAIDVAQSHATAIRRRDQHDSRRPYANSTRSCERQIHERSARRTGDSSRCWIACWGIPSGWSEQSSSWWSPVRSSRSLATVLETDSGAGMECKFYKILLDHLTAVTDR